MAKKNIFTYILKFLLKASFYSGNLLFWLLSCRKLKNYKLNSGIALVSVITILGACGNKKTTEKNQNKNERGKLQAIQKGEIRLSAAKINKHIYLQLFGTLSRKGLPIIDKEIKSVIESIGTENDNYYDARCYMPPPTEDSVLYNLD